MCVANGTSGDHDTSDDNKKLKKKQLSRAFSFDPFSFLPWLWGRSRFYLYRFTTVVSSVYTLFTLSESKTKRFLESYDAFKIEWRDKDQMIAEFGADYHRKMMEKVVDYYTVVADLCAIGQVEKMYIPPTLDPTKSIIDNQDIFEERVAGDLNMKPDSVCLEYGCGRGRITAHMAQLTGCHNMVGLQIDPQQIESAQDYAKRRALRGITFRNRDMNAIPHDYPDEHFDCIYHIAALSYCTDLDLLMKDTYRMLKPGGRFAGLDWVSLDKYNPADPRQREIMQASKAWIGAVGTPKVSDAVGALERAGFRVLVSKNPSLDESQEDLLYSARHFYTPIRKTIRTLTAWGIIPNHLDQLFQRIAEGAELYFQGEREGLITMSWYLVAEKPKEKS